MLRVNYVQQWLKNSIKIVSKMLSSPNKQKIIGYCNKREAYWQSPPSPRAVLSTPPPPPPPSHQHLYFRYFSYIGLPKHLIQTLQIVVLLLELIKLKVFNNFIPVAAGGSKILVVAITCGWNCIRGVGKNIKF